MELHKTVIFQIKQFIETYECLLTELDSNYTIIRHNNLSIDISDFILLGGALAELDKLSKRILTEVNNAIKEYEGE